MDYIKLIDRCIKIKTQKLAWEQQRVKIRSQRLACDQQCVKIRSQRLTGDQQAENLRTLRLRNDLLESQVRYNQSITSALYNQYARDLDSGAPGEYDKHSVAMMKRLFQLQNRGLQVVLSLDAPIEVKDLFPAPSDSLLTYDVIRQLIESGTYLTPVDIQ